MKSGNGVMVDVVATEDDAGARGTDGRTVIRTDGRG